MRNAVLVVSLLLVSPLVLAPVAATGTAVAAGADSAARSVAPPATVEAAGTRFVVDLEADGDARWVIRVEYVLDSPEELEAFREYADAYVNGEASGPIAADTFRAAAAAASEATGREMTIRRVRQSASVEGDIGTISLSFVWVGFLERTAPDRYRLGDVFSTPDNGTWFPALEPGQTLVVRTPPGYAVNTTSFPVLQRNRSVVIRGPWSVAEDGRLRISYAEATVRSPSPTTSPPPTTPPTTAGTPWGLVGAVVLVVGVVAGWYALGRRGSERGTPAGATEPDTGPDNGPNAGSGAVETEGDAGTTGADADAGEGTVEPEPELLSDEERVRSLLERNGGRMRQAEIVRETGWSDAKVSQLLSSMDEDGEVDKLRLGRENLISLPGADPEDGTGDGTTEDDANG